MQILTINTKRLVDEIFRSSVDTKYVLREALSNSIHANAKHIRVELFYAPQTSFLEKAPLLLQEIKIKDDGEGFTKKNRESFFIVFSDFKEAIGGKGIGRFSFLKYADSVHINSYTGEEHIEFDFSFDLKSSDIREATSKKQKSTTITLKNIREQKNVNFQNLIENLLKDIQMLLLAKKTLGYPITIVFTHNSNHTIESEYTFSSNEISSVATEKFVIGQEEFNVEVFQNNDSSKKGIFAILCANNLASEELEINKTFGFSRLDFFVVSKFFDQVNKSNRDGLNLPNDDDENTKELFEKVTRNKIKEKIIDIYTTKLKNLYSEDIKKEEKLVRERLKRRYPYIKKEYIDKNISLLDEKKILNNYRIQQNKIEDDIVSSLDEGRSVSYDEVSNFAKNALAKYIVHRSLLINSLSNIPEESKEEIIHNAILAPDAEPSDLLSNNIWLIDDKFMSYANIYSNKQLQTIINKITEESYPNENKRPDIAIFFTQDDKKNANKLVIIEFKKPGASLKDEAYSLVQCREYSLKLVEKIDSIKEIFAFSITDISDSFYRDLKIQKFNEIFSVSERVLYNNFLLDDKIPLHQYVMPIKSLLSNAKVRNSVFEAILTQQDSENEATED